MRWTMVLFMFMLDVAAYNSFVLFKIRSGDIKRRYSLEKLAVDLMMPFINSRFQKIAENNFRGTNNEVRDSFERIVVKLEKKETFSSETDEPERKKSKRGRSADCQRSKDRKTEVICLNCKKLVCGEHFRRCELCISCLEEIRKADDQEKRKSTSFTLRKKK